MDIKYKKNKYQRYIDGLYMVIFPTNKWIKRWDWLVLACLCYVAVATPYQIGVTGGYDLFYSVAWFALNVLMNVVFLVDTVLYFFRPYRGADGKDSIIISSIRNNYLKGMFIPNLLSALPYSLIFYVVEDDTYQQFKNPDHSDETINTSSTFILLLSMFKLLRLIRFKKIISENEHIINFRMKSNNQAFALLSNLCIVILLSHWFACIVCWIAFLENQSFEFTENPNWIGAYIASNSDENGVLAPGLPNPSGIGIGNSLNRYVLALFWAIQTITSIGYGNFSPVTVAEWWTWSILQLIAGIAWAYFIGVFVDIAAGFNANRREFQKRCDYANDLIKDFEPESEVIDTDTGNNNFGEKLIGKNEVGKRMRKYLHNQYKKSPNAAYECKIYDRYPVFDSLSPDLQKVASTLLLKAKLDKIPYLSSSFLNKDDQAEVAMKCIFLQFSAGETYKVCNESMGPGRGIFIMIKGIGTFGPPSFIDNRQLLVQDSIAGMGRVLIEDNHPSINGEVLRFLIYSQVLFIPRAAILAALEKNDGAAWKGSGRWVYAKTLLKKGPFTDV